MRELTLPIALVAGLSVPCVAAAQDPTLLAARR